MSTEAKTLTNSNVEEIAHWCGGLPVVQHDALDYGKTTHGVNVPVGETVERASTGDIIIRNHDGTFRIHKKSTEH
jgi:copper homeostasis protein CutC